MHHSKLPLKPSKTLSIEFISEREYLHKANTNLNDSEANMKEIDYSTLQVDGIDTRDYPDFCDAFICYGQYTDGTPLDDDALEELNQDSSLIYDLVLDAIY